MVSSAGRRSLHREFSGYVNVCAVVCLLLLFGGLSPRSSAAPYRSRAMDRQKRSPDEENSLWGNPCNYNQTNSNAEYTPKNAQYVLRQAKFTYTEALKYKDEFTNKLFTVSSFDELSSTFSEIHWLRNEKWFREEVLPKEKVLYQAMSEDAMSQLMEKIDEVLPSMYKGLKLVLAGLHVFTGSLRNTNISTDANLTEKLDKTMIDVRSVLCYFYDLMVSRNLQIEPLRDSEIPEMTKGNQLSMGFLIYRDTLNYLEYISQVFQTMAETELTKAV
ncbi:uncharacterized protein LOC106135211 isoform X1 [Amyelois transitella]|uniref:uncharacterized protein LOC106135211 isoform X1 n=2 Tax=Amyelois transitella TaxID=680683 RepID=UPI00298F43FF|nr:uncharacterized protein LOC106135211 isoform X1 [Amyelois transitella]